MPANHFSPFYTSIPQAIPTQQLLLSPRSIAEPYHPIIIDTSYQRYTSIELALPQAAPTMPPEHPKPDYACDESYFTPWKPSYPTLESNTQTHGFFSTRETKRGEMSSQLKTWEESSFREWIYSPRPLASTPQQYYQDSHHKENIKELFSPGMPMIQAGPYVLPGSTVANFAGRSSGSLSRSPRSADLVGLLRQRQASDRSCTQAHVKLQDLEYKGVMGVDGKDIKGKSKAKEYQGRDIPNPLRLSNELFRQRNIESQGYWSEYIDLVCRIDESNYNFADVDFSMEITPDDNDESRNLEYIPSSPNHLEWPCNSPTRGRGRLGCFESDMTYQNMDIGDLMRGMEVDSDEAGDELPEDMPKISCFRITSSPGDGSSKGGAAKRKRKPSPASLEGPNIKRRQVGNGEEIVSLAHALEHKQFTLFGCD